MEMAEKRLKEGHFKNGKTLYQKNIMLAKGLDQELNKRHLNAYFQILILLHNNDSITKLTVFKIVLRYSRYKIHAFLSATIL